MKRCSSCKKEKETKAFEIGKGQCRVCRNTQRRNRPKKRYEVTDIEKTCTGCDITLLAERFHKNSTVIGGLSIYCIDCTTIKTRRDYEKRKDAIIAKSDAYYQKVRGTEAYRTKARERQNRKCKENPKYKLTRLLRNRLYYALQKKSWKKNTKFSEYIGCSLEELKTHLEKQFTAGMSWNNHGEWHIDHIIPLDSAADETELYKLCHFSNLQPLWGEDNISKGAKVN